MALAFPIRRLPCRLRRLPALPQLVAPLRRLLFTPPFSTTESETDAAGVAPRRWRQGSRPETRRMALVAAAARVRLCHQLLRETRWREMRAALAKMLIQQGRGSAHVICDVLRDGFRDFDSSSVVWDALANCYAKARLTDDALYVLSQMKALDMRISVFTFDLLLYRLMKTDMALQLYQEMESCGVSPTAYSQSILIDGLCRQDRFQDALSFLHRQRKQGKFKPFGRTFRVLMSASCKFGLIEGATSFLCLKMKYGFISNKGIYNSLIHILCKSRSMIEALNLLMRMAEETQPDIFTYCSLIYGYRLLGLTGEILKIIQMMRCQGIKPDIVIYNTLMAAHCTRGDFEEAIKIKKEIVDQGLQLNIVTYNILLKALLKMGLFCEVENLLGEMHNIGIDKDIVTYDILIHFYCKIGDIGSATSLYNQIVTADLCPTIVTCNILLFGYCKIGELQVAEGHFRAIQLSSLRPTVVTYDTLMNAFVEAEDVSSMLSLFQEMERKGIRPDVITYNVVIKGLCKQIRFGDVMDVLHEMEGTGADPNYVTYISIMDAFANTGEVNSMLCIFYEMVGKGI